MKYYECDMCGEIRKSTLNFNPLKDGGWGCVEFDVNGKEIDWDYNKETKEFETYEVIAAVHHYCPLCYKRYCEWYRPLMPKGV